MGFWQRTKTFLVGYFFVILSCCSHSIAIMLATLRDRIRIQSFSSVGGRGRGASSQSALSIFSTLPPEIIDKILLQIASPYINEPIKVLLLSRRYYNLTVPKLYHFINLNNPTKFRKLKDTLGLYNPELGQHVRFLSIADDSFDDRGYLPQTLFENRILSNGLELILLSTNNLLDLHLDLFSISALHDGVSSKSFNRRISNPNEEKNPSVAFKVKSTRPIRLSTEFTFASYFNLPIFSDLRHLELLIFGLDSQSARELKKTSSLKKLKTLSLRLVSTVEKHSRRNARHDDDGLKSRVEQTEVEILEQSQDLEDFENLLEGIQVLREGGWGEEDRDEERVASLQRASSRDRDAARNEPLLGSEPNSNPVLRNRKGNTNHRPRKLGCLTIFTDPSNLSALKKVFFQDINRRNAVEVIGSDYETHRKWTLRDEFLKGLEAGQSPDETWDDESIRYNGNHNLESDSDAWREAWSSSKKGTEMENLRELEQAKEGEKDRMILELVQQFHPHEDRSSSVNVDQVGGGDDPTLLRLALDRNWKDGPRKCSLETWVEERRDGVWD